MAPGELPENKKIIQPCLSVNSGRYFLFVLYEGIFFFGKDAFSIISGFLDHIKDKIDTIILSVRQLFYALLDKISSGDELTDSDFEKAGVQTKQIVLHDDTLLDNTGIIPSLHDGTNISWGGVSPVYQNVGGSHVPFGAYNPSDHTVEIGFDWCDRFSEDNYDNIPFDFDNVLYSAFSELRNLRDDIGDVIGKILPLIFLTSPIWTDIMILLIFMIPTVWIVLKISRQTIMIVISDP